MNEKNKKGNEWNSSLAFIMALIGSAIGIGNIWRYPYVVYSNGGGAFLIPYITSILIMALPFYFLEYAVGVKFKTSLPNLYKKIKKPFEYIGWLISFAAFLILIYYIVIVGWDLIYFIISFTKGWGANPDIFFSQTLLHSSNSINGLTQISWPILGSLIFIWVLIWGISHQNLNSGIGKICKIFIPSLIGIMVIIVFYCLTLPGASAGVIELFNPDWNTLLNLNIWLAAAGQILFSIGLGWGVITTYASYLPEEPNIVKDGTIVTIANCSFELFTAIGVFSILGFMSLTEHVPVEKVVTEGTGLIFIAFPTVFNKMGAFSYIIGPLFFLCVFLAGITTIISILEPLSNGITSKFKIKRKRIVSILCLIGFIMSLIFTTGMGEYLVKIVDEFINEFGILLIIILECIVFGWFYNPNKLLKIINKNKKRKLGNWWVYLIKYIIPIIFIGLWLNGIYEIISSKNLTSIIIQTIVLIILLGIPAILTKLPEKSGKIESVK